MAVLLTLLLPIVGFHHHSDRAILTHELELLLMDRAGFVIASSVCFWMAARAFDATHPLRDAAFAVAVSVASYLLFVRMLQLSLPAGVLAGWL